MSDAPQFGNETPAGLRMFSTAFDRRWLRWSIVGLVIALVGATAYYRLVVEPELTGTRFRVWVAGEADHVTFDVDHDAGVVSVLGGVHGLSQVIASDDSLFVLGGEVGAISPMTWVEIPWGSLPLAPDSLAAERVSQALSIDSVECESLSSDTAALLSTWLDATSTGVGVSLCGSGAGAAADAGEDVLVAADFVSPSEFAPVPNESVVALADLANADSVLTAAAEHLNGE